MMRQMDDERSKFEGMTVIERLAAAGLLSAYDEAISKADWGELRRIAAEVDLHVDEKGMFWSKPGLERK